MKRKPHYERFRHGHAPRQALSPALGAQLPIARTHCLGPQSALHCRGPLRSYPPLLALQSVLMHGLTSLGSPRCVRPHVCSYCFVGITRWVHQI